MKIFIKNKQKSILSIILVAVIFILNLLPVFALETTRYENVWEKMSQSEKDEWAKFLSGIPKLNGVNPYESEKVASFEDMYNFASFFGCLEQEDYSGKNFQNYRKKVAIDLNDYEYDIRENWYYEKDTILKNVCNLTDEEAYNLADDYGDLFHVRPYIAYKARQVDEILKKHYGLSANYNINSQLKEEDIKEAIYETAILIYSKKFGSYMFCKLDMCGFPCYSVEVLPQEVYRIANGLYYIACIEKEWVMLPDNEYTTTKKTHIIIRRNDLQDDWRMYKYGKGWLTEAEVTACRNRIVPPVDVNIDYSKTKKYENSDEYIAYLDEILKGIDGDVPSDTAISDITRYAEFTLQNASETEVISKHKKLLITAAMVRESVKKQKKAKKELDKLLAKYNITPNKELEAIVRFKVGGVDIKKGIRVEFENGVQDELAEVSGLRIFLDERGHCIYISKEDLQKFMDESSGRYIEIRKEGDKYIIVFLTDKKSQIDKISGGVMFAIPADSEYYSIMAEYKGGKDNWGGQYDTNNKTLEFKTKYSGEYSILEEKINITDIDGLDEKTAQAVRFMVSKGYMTLTDGAFNPNAVLSRNDFTAALVRIFFALDREKKTSFKDVAKDSSYYPYIASAESDGIAKGYEDGTFRGTIAAKKENVIAFCARTLADKKGYSYPDDIENYLEFDDSADISNWAKNDIALAVRNALVEKGGDLNPKSDITRAESAEILYKLFMLLYDTSPVSMTSEEQKQTNMMLGVGAGGVVVLAAAGAGIVWYRKKRVVNAQEVNAQGND